MRSWRARCSTDSRAPARHHRQIPRPPARGPHRPLIAASSASATRSPRAPLARLSASCRAGQSKLTRSRAGAPRRGSRVLRPGVIFRACSLSAWGPTTRRARRGPFAGTSLASCSSPGPTGACCGCRSRARRWTASAARVLTRVLTKRRGDEHRSCMSSSITPPLSISPAAVCHPHTGRLQTLEHSSIADAAEGYVADLSPGWRYRVGPGRLDLSRRRRRAPAAGGGRYIRSALALVGNPTSPGLICWRRPATWDTVVSPPLVSLLTLIAQTQASRSSRFTTITSTNHELAVRPISPSSTTTTAAARPRWRVLGASPLCGADRGLPSPRPRRSSGSTRCGFQDADGTAETTASPGC